MDNFSNWESLISSSYKGLLNTSRNYAAFNIEQVDKYVMEFSNSGAEMILDPMSGYGTLTKICNQRNIASFCVEINFPSYLWQYLQQHLLLGKR